MLTAKIAPKRFHFSAFSYWLLYNVSTCISYGNRLVPKFTSYFWWFHYYSVDIWLNSTDVLIFWRVLLNKSNKFYLSVIFKLLIILRIINLYGHIILCKECNSWSRTEKLNMDGKIKSGARFCLCFF